MSTPDTRTTTAESEPRLAHAPTTSVAVADMLSQAARVGTSSIIAADDLRHRVSRAVQAASASLIRKQRTMPFAGRGAPGAHWCAELEGDSILSSEYFLMKCILGQQNEPGEKKRLARIVNQLRLSQRADGSWGQYPGAPIDVSASVKAYLTLKIVGDDTDAPHMARAREAIIRAGGAEKCNTFSTFYLACLGIVSWEACPAIPPQIVLLPKWFPFHMDKVAAWTRTMILPLALCSALQPVRTLSVNIDELFIDKRFKRRLSKRINPKKPISWHNFFLLVDKGLKLARRVGFTPLRQRSIRLAEAWITQRMDPETTEGLGAIFPPMVYVQIAFQKLGYTRSHPLIRQAEADLDAFMIDEPNADPRLDHIRLQPCFSPVWDTAIALDALIEAGHRAHNNDAVAKACDWLRQREVTRPGDWMNNLRPHDRTLKPGVDMACWAFEYRNDWYPDVDDTAMVAKALHKAGDRPGEHVNRDAAARAVRFVFAMQNDDGGWAAFDRTKDRRWMEAIPFADHNAMQDPSCSDITGRVLESLATCGVDMRDARVGHAMEYLLRTQQPEGCWWGRWGCNYIYGTWQAINGLIAGRPSLNECQRARADAAMDRARAWLLACQNPDGGFGESANSYLDRSLMGKGPSTASQTAWGLITLMHLLPIDHPSIERAAAYLVGNQLTAPKRPFASAQRRGDNGAPGDNAPAEIVGSDALADDEGSWAEHWFTGTGFPKVFYLRYHYYRHSFPLKALARFAERRWGTTPSH
ncbi:MAG: squalene--hopene cyclase [Phycisphaerales bacterium]|jgi:squalene-hopene/tetraprenyl-beta-curcumene cyclase|nr:squalene--hopene cyclase [Phycisphaeraceae bacterium]